MSTCSSSFLLSVSVEFLLLKDGSFSFWFTLIHDEMAQIKKCGCSLESVPASIRVMWLLYNEGILHECIIIELPCCKQIIFSRSIVQKHDTKNDILEVSLPWLHFWLYHSFHMIIDGRKLKCPAFNFLMIIVLLVQKGAYQETSIRLLLHHENKSRAW